MFGKPTGTPTNFTFGAPAAGAAPTSTAGGFGSAPISTAGGFGSAPAGAGSSTPLAFNNSTTNNTFGGTGSATSSAFGVKPPTLQINPSNTLAQQQQQPQQQQVLFNNSNQQSTGLFGATQNQNQGFKPPGLFGQAAPTAAGTGTGLFGQAAPAAPAATGTGLFGNTNNTANQGGLFGNTQPNSTTTNLFGNNTQQNTTGGLFGNNTQQNTTGGLFGNNTQQNTTGGLFGNTSQQNTTGGLFGNTSQQNTTTGMFGNPTATNQAQGGMFGSNKPGLFGQPFSGAQQQQQQQQNMYTQPHQPQATDIVKNIADCWNPKTPICHFKYYFYNNVHPSEVHLYQPEPGSDPSLYAQAQLDNPDPASLVPVLAVGFEGLKTRLDTQDAWLAQSREKIEELKARLNKIEQTHTIETVVKISQFKKKHGQISHKVLQLMKTVQLLRNKGYSLRGEEEALMTRLSSMERDLAKPSVFRGRINEIYAQVQQLKDAGRAGGGGMSEEVGVLDPDSLRPVIESLEWMGNGLAQLTAVVNQDEEEIETLEQGYQEAAMTS